MSRQLRPRIFFYKPRRQRMVYGPRLLRALGAKTHRLRYLLWTLIALGAAFLIAVFWIPVAAGSPPYVVLEYLVR